ncbi:chloride channel CLIC-like protein 1 [Caerostris darwini]|uniref:Chloride channel CLIC-like protein 1 n=1 Tax=Caerostris darwini TaxID=1538125 RepID=A0AAV4S7P2_9ARAC|nr:chloride channel CLIC-like protein 1 [Caerostris darwini]
MIDQVQLKAESKLKPEKDNNDSPEFVNARKESNVIFNDQIMPDLEKVIVPPGKNIVQNTGINSIQYSGPLELDIDERPIFSDIKGAEIREKPYTTDDKLVNVNKETFGSFSKRPPQISILDSIYLARWMKKLVMKVEQSNLVPSGINFPLDTVGLNNLKELAAAKSIEISELDDLICSMIDQSTVTTEEKFDWSMYTDFAKDLMWPVVVAMSAAVCAYVIYQVFLYRPAFTIMICIVGVSIFWHWMHLYQQRQALKHAELSSMTIPTECRKNDFGLIEHFQEYIKSFFTSNECAKYYEALMVDPVWEVSFTMAASEAVTAMLFQPLSAASRAVNLALKQLFDGLSIFVIIPVMIFIFLLLIMLCNYRVKLPFFMGALEPHTPPAGSRVEEVKPSKALKIIRDTLRKLLPGPSSEAQGNLPRRCRNQRCIQRCSGQSGAHCEFRSLGSSYRHGNCLPCEACNVIEPAMSEDDISIIDSEEDGESDDSRGSQLTHHCCSCCFPEDDMPNMHVDCRVCEDRMNTQNAGNSVQLSSRSSELETGDNEAATNMISDTIPVAAGNILSE